MRIFNSLDIQLLLYIFLQLRSEAFSKVGVEAEVVRQ